MNSAMREARYQSYVLRCWCEGSPAGEAAPAWRFSIERIGSGEAAIFLDGVDDLAGYVHEQLSAPNLDRLPPGRRAG